jgi:hypothetical protein
MLQLFKLNLSRRNTKSMWIRDFVGTDVEFLGKLHVPLSKRGKNKDIFWSYNILLSQIK